MYTPIGLTVFLSNGSSYSEIIIFAYIVAVSAVHVIICHSHEISPKFLTKFLGDAVESG